MRMKQSKADIYARILLGLIIVGGLMLISTYSFGLAMMSLPLIFSGIFILFVVLFPVVLIVRMLKGKRKSNALDDDEIKPSVHDNDGERTILYRSDEDATLK